MTAQPIITVNVSGMTCGGCAKSVREAVEGVDGVAGAQVDHVSGRVDVTPAGTVSRDDLEFSLDEAISAAGYEVK
ncbi:heavy-metal-associated domain-containing protein [Demequina sediminicola]|uniref:heavy-metal-associated domain-containing protein n=1 Tax=Demequina sediminicola TaxID=1095026 RepID=UPI0007821D93|nr:heavy metal-associated domain-containing protein [Demequina sediminicola]